MKLKVEDILKPGCVLEAKKIDFNDPNVRKLWAATRREQKKLAKLRNAPFKNYRITI